MVAFWENQYRRQRQINFSNYEPQWVHWSSLHHWVKISTIHSMSKTNTIGWSHFQSASDKPLYLFLNRRCGPLICRHLTREPTVSSVLTKWWNLELTLACQFLTKWPNFGDQLWFCTRLLMWLLFIFYSDLSYKCHSPFSAFQSPKSWLTPRQLIVYVAGRSILTLGHPFVLWSEIAIKKRLY